MNTQVKDGSVLILMAIDGEVHLVTLPRAHFEGLVPKIKEEIVDVFPTGRTQAELRQFLRYEEEQTVKLTANYLERMYMNLTK